MLEFADLAVGMRADAEIAWTLDDLETFRRLTGDDAPVHRDDDFARSVGMPGRIVYGLLLAAPFSRLLGCELPGPLSVIHSLRVDFARAVQPDEKLRYTVTIAQLSPATGAVVLDLGVAQADHVQVLRGRAQCGVAR